MNDEHGVLPFPLVAAGLVALLAGLGAAVLVFGTPAGAGKDQHRGAERGNAMGAVGKFEEWRHGTLLDVDDSLVLSDALQAVDATGYRITYLSTGYQDNPTVVTGVFLLPPGRPPKGGWPVISWGSGGSNLGDGCAPSRLDPFDRYAGDVNGTRLILPTLLDAGFAIVASDYEGFGTPGTRPFYAPRSEGRSVVDAVFAVRQGWRGQLSKTWAGVGHSGGGHAVLDAAEVADEGYADGTNFLGSVAIEGLADFSYLADLDEPVAQANDLLTGQITRGTYLQLLVGQKTQHPELKFSDYLGSAALAVNGLDLVYNECRPAIEEAYAGVPTSEFEPVSQPARDQLRTWLTNGGVPRGKIEKPIFVQTGTPSRLFPVMRSGQIELCSNGTTVLYKLYGDFDHSQIADVGAPDTIQWIRDRMAGLPAPHDCSQL